MMVLRVYRVFAVLYSISYDTRTVFMTLQQNSLQRNISVYYAYKFLKWFAFWVPIYALYFQTKGLSYTELLTLLLIQSVAQIVCEVPSGIFADFFGRKTALMIAAAGKLISIVLMLFGQQFWVFALGWAFFGMHAAFESGADTSMVYDTLKELKREKEYTRIVGNGMMFEMIAMATSAFIGGFIASFSFEYTLMLTAVSFFLATVMSFFFQEPQRHQQASDRNYLKHLSEAGRFAWQHPHVKWLCILSGAMIGGMLITHWYFQPYMQQAGIQLSWFGTIYLVWLGTSAVASRFADRVQHRIGERRSLLLIPILLGIHLLILSTGAHWFGVAGILLNQFAWGFTHPVLTGYIHRHVESHHRATVLSLAGFLQSVCTVFAPLIGYLIDQSSLSKATLAQGVFMLAIGFFCVWKLGRTLPTTAASATESTTTEAASAKP